MQEHKIAGDLRGVEDFLAREPLGGVGGDRAGEGSVDHAVDHEMRDMDSLGPKFARRTLRQSPQRVLGASEGGIADAAAHTCGRAGDEDRARAAWNHHARRLAHGEKAGERRHLPYLAIDPFGRVGQTEAHIGADVGDDDFERPEIALDGVEQRDHLAFLARVKGIGARRGARRAQIAGQRLQRLGVARPAGYGDSETVGGEGARDGRAQPVAGPHD